ncbi:adenylylsulfate kinase-like enzyme [Mycobacteroides chelonae]|nr:adenylylsulfate kinase-like enzyme [Mycobacteroides chelonae]
MTAATPRAECEKPDPKGPYARARPGELKGRAGVEDPYDAPANPELVLDTTGADIDGLAA